MQIGPESAWNAHNSRTHVLELSITVSYSAEEDRDSFGKGRAVFPSAQGPMSLFLSHFNVSACEPHVSYSILRTESAFLKGKELFTFPEFQPNYLLSLICICFPWPLLFSP